MLRFPAVSANSSAPGHAWIHGRRVSCISESLRRSRHAAFTECQQYAGAPGVPANRIHRHQRPHGLCDIRYSRCDLPIIHVGGHEVAKGKGLRHRAKGRRRSGQTPHAVVGEGYGLVHHPFNYDSGAGASFWPYAALFWNHLVIQHLARCFQL